MTQNVNAYLATQENVRSNKAREEETARHNRTVEELSLQQHREQARHNVRQEYLTAQSHAIQQHQAETARMSVLHQGNVLAETKRANLAHEALQRQANATQLFKASADVQLGLSSLAESRRHSLALEALTADKQRKDYSVAMENTRIGWANQSVNERNSWNNVAATGAKYIDAFIPF